MLGLSFKLNDKHNPLLKFPSQVSLNYSIYLHICIHLVTGSQTLSFQVPIADREMYLNPKLMACHSITNVVRQLRVLIINQLGTLRTKRNLLQMVEFHVLVRFVAPFSCTQSISIDIRRF